MTTPSKLTKLGRYLKQTGESHRSFAERAKIAHLHPMVSQWAVYGKRIPGLDVALAIEKATGGEVPASYWPSVRAANDDSKRAVGV